MTSATPAPENESARQRRCRRQREATAEALTRETRRAIIARDGATCYLCGEPLDLAAAFPDPQAVTLDHVVPLARGGAHTPDNLRVACRPCNLRKGDKLPAELAWYDTPMEA